MDLQTNDVYNQSEKWKRNLADLRLMWLDVARIALDIDIRIISVQVDLNMNNQFNIMCLLML